jgi:hypothetical protein
MQLQEQDYQELAFVDNLVKAITGRSLESIPDANKALIVEKTMNIYQNYIIGYFKQHFDDKAQMRIKQVIREEKTILFEKFPDLQTQFDEAYTSFIQYISTI